MKSIKASIALEIHKESRRVNRQICTKRKAAGLPVKLGRKITNFSPAATKRRASAKRAKLARDELQNVIKLLSEGAGDAEVALLKIAGTAAGKKQWPILAAALRDGENAQRVEAAVAQIVRQQGLSPNGKKKRSAHRGPFIAMLAGAHDGSLSPRFLANCGLSPGYVRNARSRMKKNYEWPHFLLDTIKPFNRASLMVVQVIFKVHLY